MLNEFISGSDWQSTSGRYVPFEADLDDVWPVGSAQNKDEAFAGMHPILAIGSPSFRPLNVTGVVVTYDPATGRVLMNIAPGAIVKQYVCNITGYSGGVANAWASSLVVGQPVYVDDSVEVGLGCTLSCSNTNSAGAVNPLAGYVVACQNELSDAGIGGGNTDPFPKAFATNTDEAWLTVCVMLWPDAH